MMKECAVSSQSILKEVYLLTLHSELPGGQTITHVVGAHGASGAGSHLEDYFTYQQY